MRITTQETLACDVLVIGSGGAGLRAAIAARMDGADVLLVSKTGIGPTSNTYLSKAVIAASGWGDPDDNARVHIEDTIKGGCFLNDQRMVAQLAQNAHAEVAFLQQCGVRFEGQEGRPRLVKIAGHRYSRHVHGTHWKGGDLVAPLKRCAQDVGARMREHIFITRLIATSDQISGAAGLDANGCFYAIHAKAVVLATGGYAQIYLNTNNAPGITGDGQAMAYRVGVPLKDMEFVQFYPTAAGKRGSRLMLYERMLAQKGAVLINQEGENVLARHGVTEPSQVTRDRLTRIVFRELNQSQSSEQNLYMDLRAISKEAAESLGAVLPTRWHRGEKVFQVTPTTHFCMGGIVTNPSGETPLKGLFAVGEATAGAHGANRLGGNALAEIFTLGARVGANAAQKAKQSEARTTANAFEAEQARLEQLFSNQGQSIRQSVLALKQLIWEHVGVIRDKKGLEAAMERLQDPLPQMVVSNSSQLIRLMELRNMRRVAALVCRAALERTESRGSHFRSDFPNENNPEWLKNIVLRQGKEGVQVETRPVRLDLVDMEE